MLTRDCALELFLNVADWGTGRRGVAAAAWGYFRRSPLDLDAFQSVVLASILCGPDEPLRGVKRYRTERLQLDLLRSLHVDGFLSANDTCSARRKAEILAAALFMGATPAVAISRIADWTPIERQTR